MVNATEGKARVSASLPLPPGARLGKHLRITQIVGHTSRGGLYLGTSTRSDRLLLIWESKGRRPATWLGNPAGRFDEDGWHYQVYFAEGVSLAGMLRTGGRLDEEWVVTTWADVCRVFGNWHVEKPPLIALAHQPIDLNAYKFDSSGEILPPSIYVASAASWDQDSPVVFFAGDDDEELPSADVYALGSALYMLTTGRPPSVPGKPQVSPRKLNPSLDQHTQLVIGKALQPRQANRYQDGHEMAAALRKLAELLRSRKRRTRRTSQPVPWALVGFIFVVVLLLALAVAGGVLGLFIPPPVFPPTDTPSPQPTSVLVIPPPPEPSLTPSATLEPPVSVEDVSLTVNQVSQGEEGDEGDGPTFPVVATPTVTPAPGGAVPFLTGTPPVTPLQGSDGLLTPTPPIGPTPELDRPPGQEDTTVTSYASLLDKEGNPIGGVPGRQFAVYQDGQLLTGCQVDSVSEVSDPVSAVIAIDISGSMSGEALEKAKQAAIEFVTGSRPEDRLLLIQFDDRIEFLSDFTQDQQTLVALVGSLQSRGNTSLYDMLYQATGRLAAESGRLALVVLTDGKDTTSQAHSLEDGITLLKQHSVPVFAIGLMSDQFDETALKLLEQETNGRYLFAPTPDELSALYRQVRVQLENQYRIICPSLAPNDGGQHEIRITVNDGEHEATGSKFYIAPLPGQ